MKNVVAVLAIMFSLSLNAQQDPVRNRDGRSPREVLVLPAEEIAQLYFSLSDLALHDQREQLWALSSKTKAALWTFNIERYLRNHPELAADAREAIREGVSLIMTPGWFDIQKGSFGYEAKRIAVEEHKRRVQSIVQPEVIREVFIRLGPEPVSYEFATAGAGSAAPGFSPASVQQPGKFPLRETYDGCNCFNWFDCPPLPFGCHTSYCEVVIHCGWYDDDPCIGRCKLGW